MNEVCAREDVVVVLRARTGRHRQPGQDAVLRARYCSTPTVRSVAATRPSGGGVVLEAYRPGVSEAGVDARHRDVVVLEPGERVLRHVVDTHLEVAVRPGGLAGAAHLGDRVTGLDVIADGDEQL
jgi:hypothetical protein